MSSLRTRLMIGIAMTVALGFAATSRIIYSQTYATTLREFDAALATQIRALATMVEQDGTQIEADFLDCPMEEFTRKKRPSYFQLWSESRKTIGRSKRLQRQDLSYFVGTLDKPGFQSIALPDGRAGRQVSVQFLPTLEELHVRVAESEHSGDDDGEFDGWGSVDFAARQRVTLAIAKETVGVDRAMRRIGWLLFATTLTAVAITLIAAGLVIQMCLKPLGQLADQIGAMREDELGQNIELDSIPSELAPIVSRLNGLFLRLKTTLQRERQFSADVAHELRTPLAGLRSTVEVALRRQRDIEEYRQSLQECGEISIETQRVVETLLSLSRIESGKEFATLQRVRSLSLIENAWRLHTVQAKERDLDVCFVGVEPFVFVTDEEKLLVVLCNILGNAVDYTNDSGRIEIRFWRANGQSMLEVVNSGCELQEQELEHVFNRFWQGDTARSQTGSHAGLGLAISKRIVELLEGHVSAQRVDGNFVLRVTLPDKHVGGENVELSNRRKMGVALHNQ